MRIIELSEKLIMASGGPKTAARVRKGVKLIIGCSNQLLLNKSFDLSTPSMRKGRDEGKTGKRKNDGNSGHYVGVSRPPNGDRLQCRPHLPIVATNVIDRVKGTACNADAHANIG